MTCMWVFCTPQALNQRGRRPILQTLCVLQDKREKRNPALRREYSAVTGVYHVPLGAEKEVVTITPRGKCSLETGKWNSYYFPLAVCKKPGHTWRCLHSILRRRVSRAQPHSPPKSTDQDPDTGPLLSRNISALENFSRSLPLPLSRQMVRSPRAAEGRKRGKKAGWWIGKNTQLSKGRTTGALGPALPFTSCGTLGKLLNLPASRFLLPQ